MTRSPRGTPSFFAAQTIEAPSALIRGHSLRIDASSGSASIRLTLEALITTCWVGTPLAMIFSISSTVSSSEMAFTYVFRIG